MVTKIPMYRTKDGKLFNNIEDAEKYEVHYTLVRTWIDALIPKYIQEEKTCNFANGSGYIQANKEIIQRAWNFVEEQYRLRFPDLTSTSRSFIGRVLSDSDDSNLYSLFTILYSTDDNYRIWGQPFYALNPGQGTDLCLGTLENSNV